MSGAPQAARPAVGPGVPQHDRGSQVRTGLAGTLSHGECAGDEGRTGMYDVAQVAIVRRRGIAHHGIDLRGIGHRQFRARSKPHGSYHPPAPTEDLKERVSKIVDWCISLEITLAPI